MKNLNTEKIKELQKKLGVTADGDWGPISQAAFEKALKPISAPAANGRQSPILIALEDYGTKEIDGSMNNAKIMQYYRDVGQTWITSEDVAWCAAFVGSCLERALIASSRLLNARSYLKWGIATTKPKVGDIAVFSRGSNPAEGHVAFFIREEGSNVFILGGNQANAVNITTMPKSTVLGYRTYR